MPARQNGEICVLNIRQGASAIELTVTFGDVYICTGQSNMNIDMSQIHRSNDELAKVESTICYTDMTCNSIQAKEYVDIHTFKLGYMHASHPKHKLSNLDVIARSTWPSWFDSSK